MIRFLAISSLVIFFCFNIFAQNEAQKLAFDGQVSAISSFSPENDLNTFLGIRYIPELSYGFALDSMKMLDFEASANFSSSLLMHPFDSVQTNGDIQPYRIWARYTAKQFELRVGLQKIDFGAATLLRPIQWFNQIDPRDPLQLTNGVYGVLGRYYFLNNANIWFWALYGNEKTRGFDAIETNKKIPEMGGRVQIPMERGEIATSYHYRTANSENSLFVSQFEKIPEHRVGIDGKWDIGIGLWFEAAYIYKTKNVSLFTHQNLLNIGADYTFGIGNGINMVAEHLMTNFDEEAFGFDNTSHLTAITLSYPLGFFDNLSAIFYYDWKGENATAFLNYEHQFKKVVGYLMFYYNPTTQQGIQQNDFVNQFSGPGVRLMFVFNH
ncbi:MAG: hypothetical protein ACPG5B_01205 [Chitinophagales bacterium]